MKLKDLENYMIALVPVVKIREDKYLIGTEAKYIDY